MSQDLFIGSIRTDILRKFYIALSHDNERVLILELSNTFNDIPLVQHPD